MLGCKEDERCVSHKPYPCLNCSATYLPCGGDCKPIIRKSSTNLVDKNKWLNCCSYCIKTNSCAKVENEYLKSIRYNDPHYLKTGQGCIVNIENKHLKDEQDKREAFKKACHGRKKINRVQKKVEKGQTKYIKGKLKKEREGQYRYDEWSDQEEKKDRKREMKELKQKKEREKKNMVMREKRENIEAKKQERRAAREERRENRVDKLEKQKQDRAAKEEKEAKKEKVREQKRQEKALDKRMRDEEDSADRQYKEEEKQMVKKMKLDEKIDKSMENQWRMEEKQREKKEKQEDREIDKINMKEDKEMERQFRVEGKQMKKQLKDEKDIEKKLKRGEKKNIENKLKEEEKETRKKLKAEMKERENKVRQEEIHMKKKVKETTKKLKESNRTKEPENLDVTNKAKTTKKPKGNKAEITSQKTKPHKKVNKKVNKKVDKKVNKKVNKKVTKKVKTNVNKNINKKANKNVTKALRSKSNTDDDDDVDDDDDDDETDDDDDTSVIVGTNYATKTLKDVCYKGICSNAATNRAVKFICKCKKRRLFKPQCTNQTCVGDIPAPGESTLKKISCVCKKVSMKILGNGNQDQVCKWGQCQRAKEKCEDFVCKCLPQVKCLSVTTCAKNTKFKQLALEARAKNISENEGKCDCGLKWKKIGMQDRIDQTGEPVFEVQVRRRGQEIANLEEVQEKVKNLGRSRIPCTCPTFNKNLEHSIKNVCPTGTCRKALNGKSISINCKCESRKYRFCTDKTCNLRDMKTNLQSSGTIDPIFSLNVNTDKNTILNSSDIQQRITSYRNKNKFCKIGRCRDSFNTGELDFTCECRKNMDICTDKTCDDVTQMYHIPKDDPAKCKKESPPKRPETKEINKSMQPKTKGKGGNKTKIKGERNPDHCLAQGVSVKVSRKKKLEGFCECDVDNCDCPPRSRLACIAQFCGRQEKPNTLIATKSNNYSPLSKRKLSSFFKKNVTAGNGNKELQKYETGSGKKTVQNKENFVPLPPSPEVEDDEDKFNPNPKKEQKIEEVVEELHPNPKKKQMKDVSKGEKENLFHKHHGKAKPKKEKLTPEQAAKEKELKELEKWEKEELMRIDAEMAEEDVHLCAACISGLLSFIFQILSKLFTIIYTLVRHPKVAFAYVREKLKDPKLTFRQTKRLVTLYYRAKVMRIRNNFAKSDTANMLIDELLTSKYVKLLLPKDKATHNDLVMRMKRKIKRRETAMYSCKHITLLTMKELPCMWFFYLCPEFYPRLLSCLTVTRKFLDVFMAIGAIIVWTPFFVALEIIRLSFCCTICTQ